MSRQELSLATKTLPFQSHRNLRLSNRWSLKELGQLLRGLDNVSFKQRNKRRTIWSFKDEATLQAYSFAATWNNFLGGALAKEGDIYRIFAAMQDFKAAPFREVPDELRMKAILKGDPFLPLDLFFSGASGTSNTGEQRDDDAGSSWVPSVPSGRQVDCQVGYLRIHTDCCVMQSSSIQSVLISLATCRRVPHNSSVLIQSGSHTKQVFIQHGLSDRHHASVSQPQRSDSLSLHCILFPEDTSSLHHAATWYDCGGALFEVVSHDANTTHLTYQCGVRVHAYNTIDSAETPQTCFRGRSVSRDCQIFIDCGQSFLPKLPVVTPSVISGS